MVSTDHKVVQYVEAEKDPKKQHPVLRTGDFHVTGTIEHSAAAELCSPDAELDAYLVSLKRTASGGIAYEFAIRADEKPAQERRKQVDAEAKAKSDADAKAAAQLAADVAQKAQDEADARLARVVAAAVKQAIAEIKAAS